MNTGEVADQRSAAAFLADRLRELRDAALATAARESMFTSSAGNGYNTGRAEAFEAAVAEAELVLGRWLS